MRSALYVPVLVVSVLAAPLAASAAVKVSAEIKAKLEALKREELKEQAVIDEDYKDKEEAAQAEIQSQAAAGSDASESQADLKARLKAIKQKHKEELKELREEYQEKRADVKNGVSSDEESASVEATGEASVTDDTVVEKPTKKAKKGKKAKAAKAEAIPEELLTDQPAKPAKKGKKSKKKAAAVKEEVAVDAKAESKVELKNVDGSPAAAAPAPETPAAGRNNVIGVGTDIKAGVETPPVPAAGGITGVGQLRLGTHGN